MNDEQYLLASAYLDGELTAQQRALAEADPDVMSEVDRLRLLQAELRSVTPPSDAAREQAIGAAMSAFTQAAPRPAPPVNAVTRTVEFRRRPSYARYLGLAAGVLAVGVLGFVVANAVRTGDDDDADFDAADEVLVEEPADEPAEEPAEQPVEEQRDLTEAAAELGDDVADSEAGGFADEPASDEQPAAEASDEPADEPAAEPADEPADSDTVAPVIEPTQPLTTPTELGAYGTYLLGLQAVENLPPTPNTACPQQVILGISEYVFDGVPIDVLVAVDEQERSVSAIDPDTCETLVVGPLF